MIELKSYQISSISGGFDGDDIGYHIGYGVGSVASSIHRFGFRLGVKAYDYLHRAR